MISRKMAVFFLYVKYSSYFCKKGSKGMKLFEFNKQFGSEEVGRAITAVSYMPNNEYLDCNFLPDCGQSLMFLMKGL